MSIDLDLNDRGVLAAMELRRRDLSEEQLQRFEGYVAQYLGDGVLVYFGYPLGHEADAQRAVRRGLGILHAMAALTTRLMLPPGDRFAVRVGTIPDWW